VRVDAGPADLVFPGEFQSYAAVRRVSDATCQAATIKGARPHDARHTFAVHAAQAGVPIVRLQKLLGHATALMTMRYMKHAPEAYLQEDAAAIAGDMAGKADPEAAARAEAARNGLKTA
jgi:integrase